MSSGDQPTLRSIAAALELDVSTVSRILNGTPASARKAAGTATVERVRAHAAEVGYTVDPNAVSLRTRRSGLIAVVIPRLSDGVLAYVVEGIEDEARLHDLTVFVASTHDDPDAQRDRIRIAMARRAEGIVIADGRLDTPLPDALRNGRVPFILANRATGDHPSVVVDEREGGRLVGRHLLDQGCSKVAVIAGPAHASTATERTRGCVEELESGGAEPLRINSTFDIAGGREAMHQVLALQSGVDGVFAVDDYAALGAASVARDRGLRIGHDLALVGYNDTPIAAELSTPLTSVAHATEELGRVALRKLVELRDGGTTDSVVLPPRLVERASSRLAFPAQGTTGPAGRRLDAGDPSHGDPNPSGGAGR